MKDEILDFIEDHRKLCIGVIIAIILIGVLLGVRSSNIKKKAEAEAKAQAEEAQAELEAQLALAQDVETEEAPKDTYKNSLGLDKDKDKDERIEVDTTPETVPEPVYVQTTPTYSTTVNIFDHTSVPTKNMDGSSCKAYQSKVTLSDFGSYWGSNLTEEDFYGGDFYMIGVEQNPDDTLKGDLQSTGWLINNIDTLNDNDAIKFTNLHVIGQLSTSHVALLCSYDWYSAFGMDDTLVVFEDISGDLKIGDFSDGDIFSATVFKHNIKVMNNVKGQRVIVVEYATFD
jgi:type II secretory pathway pseudopilin PulG